VATTVALTATPAVIDVDGAATVLVQNQSASSLIAIHVAETAPSIDKTDVILRPLEWGRWTGIGVNESLYGWVVGRDLSGKVQLDGGADMPYGAIRWMEDEEA
jgi:hypothetical protein